MNYSLRKINYEDFKSQLNNLLNFDLIFKEVNSPATARNKIRRAQSFRVVHVFYTQPSYNYNKPAHANLPQSLAQIFTCARKGFQNKFTRWEHIRGNIYEFRRDYGKNASWRSRGKERR